MLILSHAVYALPFYIYNLINSYFPPHLKSIAINCFVSSSSLFFPLKSNCVCGNGPHWHRVPNELRAATSELTVNQRREENPQFAAIFTFHLHLPSSIQNQSQPGPDEYPLPESPTWALLAKVVILGCKKKHFQCRYEKSETTFIRQTFPKNEVCDLWFHFWPLLHAFFGDFHFLALLGPILEGKSDQN